MSSFEACYHISEDEFARSASWGAVEDRVYDIARKRWIAENGDNGSWNAGSPVITPLTPRPLLDKTILDHTDGGEFVRYTTVVPLMHQEDYTEHKATIRITLNTDEWNEYCQYGSFGRQAVERKLAELVPDIYPRMSAWKLEHSSPSRFDGWELNNEISRTSPDAPTKTIHRLLIDGKVYAEDFDTAEEALEKVVEILEDFPAVKSVNVISETVQLDGSPLISRETISASANIVVFYIEANPNPRRDGFFINFAYHD